MVEYESMRDYWARAYLDERITVKELSAKLIILEADLKTANERIKKRDKWIKALEDRLNEQKKERNGN